MLRSLAALSLAAGLCAQSYRLDDGFENGNLDGWSFDGSWLTVNTHNPPGAWQWLHFRVRGVLGQSPRFRTNTTASDDVYRSYHRMVWRYEDDPTWHLMDNGSKPGNGFYEFWNDARFQRDAIFVAYWYPFTQTQLVHSLLDCWLRALDTAAAGGSEVSGMLELSIVGSSQQGLPLIHYSITDRSVPDRHKPQVVFIGRQHGYESLGNYAIEGMTRFLVSPDPLAAQLRRTAVWHFYPLTNPDAVWHGWTREGRDRTGLQAVDFNRDWAIGSVLSNGPASRSLEIDLVRVDAEWRTGGRAALLVDIHSHAKGSAGLGWYWWEVGAPLAALELVTAIWQADRTLPGGTVFSWPSATAGSNSPTAMNWGAPRSTGNAIGTLGALSLTLEPIAAPFGAVRDVDRLRDAGVSILRGIGAAW
ncbi:MAG: hypothetical protein IPM29_07005 [Planctomycetes bacterium]|nr:hypothetical protein [Planctomycetota bacterium]